MGTGARHLSRRGEGRSAFHRRHSVSFIIKYGVKNRGCPSQILIRKVLGTIGHIFYFCPLHIPTWNFNIHVSLKISASLNLIKATISEGHNVMNRNLGRFKPTRGSFNMIKSLRGGIIWNYRNIFHSFYGICKTVFERSLKLERTIKSTRRCGKLDPTYQCQSNYEMHFRWHSNIALQDQIIHNLVSP